MVEGREGSKDIKNMIKLLQIKDHMRYFFRWFKFTLKPPYSGVSESSLLAIWDTSHWKFLSNLVSGQFETSLMTSYCHF